MRDSASIDAKRDFVRWILEDTKLRERGCIMIFKLLRDNIPLLEKIHFSDDGAKYAPHGAIISLRGVYTVPFRYFKRGLGTREVASLIHDITSLDCDFYIQINLPEELKNDVYYNAIIECPYSKPVVGEDIEEEIEEFIDRVENLGALRALLAEIDTALDKRDKEKFNRLTKKLVKLISSLDDYE